MGEEIATALLRGRDIATAPVMPNGRCGAPGTLQGLERAPAQAAMAVTPAPAKAHGFALDLACYWLKGQKDGPPLCSMISCFPGSGSTFLLPLP